MVVKQLHSKGEVIGYLRFTFLAEKATNKVLSLHIVPYLWLLCM